MHRLLPLLIALLLLAGCSAPPAALTPTQGAAARPTSLPTAVPTLAPSAAAASPTRAPSGPPAPTAAQSDLLPAPLYVLDNGQIARIERDGQSRSLVTSETTTIQSIPPVATFAISPQGDLAFVVGDLKADRLVLTGPRGDSRHVLYEQEGHELSYLAWSPDGAQIYLRLLNNRDTADPPSGIYRIAAAGGQIDLLRADDSVDDTATPSPTISGYRPFSLSPDGSRLLVEVYSLYYDGCGLGVMPSGGGDLVPLEVPPGTKAYCGEAAWSPDGATVYFLAGPDSGPTIWRGDAASGATAAMMADDTLARAPHAMPGGALRFFMVSRDSASGGALRFTMAELQIPQAATAVIGPAFSDRLGQVLWAPDGDGAITVVVQASQRVDMRWNALDTQAVSLPSTGQGVNGLAWGPVE